jgi:hypothetical protein
MRACQRAAKNLNLPIIGYSGGSAHMRHEVYKLYMRGIKKENTRLGHGSKKINGIQWI